ncbi:glycosyl hydrolase family 71-domain-containing protein [Crucibulum laeve]|uniref:Glycosyl hydrolase family 71-domain-containing protein n=1 Tax=Crucibulum laeve TaxID=68775 RepID=A0A5C3M4N4_9AGAR|nr:glycosyl hydrolase family 71-domain-containing protein [Crucibulum laeve]
MTVVLWRLNFLDLQPSCVSASVRFPSLFLPPSAIRLDPNSKALILAQLGIHILSLFVINCGSSAYTLPNCCIMHYSPLLSILFFSLLQSATAQQDSNRHPSLLGFRHKHKSLSKNVLLKNATSFQGDSPAELEKRDGTKYVFMHHIVGNTYSYGPDDWKDDIRQIAAKGVDAIALNIGSSSWQPDQIRSAYAAAASIGSNLKLFISFDFTEMACSVSDVVSRVNELAGHPNQFKVNGKPMISSYAGDCLGQSGWASIKSQTNGYLMPFIWGLEGQFNNWPSLDSWYCWGCAWPQGNADKTTDDDNYYINQLGSRYATTISVWMYTHYGYKNFYQRGDNWLINTRWEQLVAMRDKLTFVEMVTWNDFGESDYFGPVKGAQPDGTTWATNFPHTAWYDMSQYYITAFKTGSYPAITEDVIYYWARPHPAGATASGDSLGRPTGFDWTPDTLWAVVFASSTSTVTLKCGSSSQTFTNVAAGVTKLKIPLAAGKITVTMVKNGQTVINETPSDFTFVTNPVLYNYNAYVGSAKATSPPVPATSTTTTASTTTATPASSTVTTPSSTPISNTGWTYLGCYPDYSPRTLANGLYLSENTQTVAKCLASCSAQGYKYAGTEYGIECFCSNSITAGVTATSSSECNMPCAGKASDICGGGNRISIYSSTGAAPTSSATTTPTATSPTATSTSFSYYGCVAEGTTGSRRALTSASFSQSNMTPQVCQTLCAGYQYAGVEYGSECYCGNTLTNNGATGAVIPASNCASSCSGDASQVCGGGWIMSVYSKAAAPPSSSTWTSAGCYVDGGDRMLRGSSTSQAGMTTEICIGICSSQSFTLAATEYGSECYCGSQLYKTGGAGVATSSNECNMPCGGNSAQTCGAGWRGNLYTAPGTAIARRHTSRRRLALF